MRRTVAERQHAFACTLLAFDLDGGSSRKRDGPSKAASLDPCDENIRGHARGFRNCD